jgi:uncharacterized membrane protein YgdD (TMEM256/DUF423 family)
MRPESGSDALAGEEAGTEMKKTAMLFMMIGSVCAFLSVAAGAFGAHALKSLLDPARLAVFETAAKYQMYHALALVVVGWQMHQISDGRLLRAGWLFCLGILLFSGSLYIVGMLGVRWAGAITPVGGLAFLGGWGLLAWAAWRRFKEV